MNEDSETSEGFKGENCAVQGGWRVESCT